ncbi:hypothetical protein V6N11_043900 [Hibiscus sabdariffa]|uniref:Endonuclease/exonuclease/phosphatase domain-containing protein n=1 Tax=Hibiscus sabdariffa TaxID=183260 RepID=A0ABR2RDM4_9ROSI
MAVFAWNVRGLGNKDSVHALTNSIRKCQPDIVFLSETKQKKRYLEKIKMKMKLENSFYVEPTGLAAGLSLWWSKDTQIKIQGYGKHFIDAEISIKSEAVWFGTFIYGPPYKEQKKEFWELMENLRKGGAFTWSNHRCDDKAILEKLDRVLCSPGWNILFPKAMAMLDIAIGSDHAPRRTALRLSKEVGSRFRSQGILIALVAS